MDSENQSPQIQPKSIHEWTVHVLNIEGIVFEKWVEVATADAPKPWTVVATQFAVEFPPPHGAARGRESALDIWAELRLGASWLSLAIEVKKNDPRFVDWVFIPAELIRLKPILMCMDAQKPSPTGTERTPQAERHPPERPFITMKVFEPDTVLADACRETRGTWLSQETREATRTSGKAIGDAAHQVAIAVQAIIQDEMEFWMKEIKEDGHFPEWSWKTFMPVIVTTANLRVLDFHPNLVDPKTGTILHTNTTLRDVDWLVYLYSVPRHLQFGLGGNLQRKEQLREAPARMPIFVVRGDHFPTFLKNLIKDHALYAGP